jgi:UDP-glucose 4-epimerase
MSAGSDPVRSAIVTGGAGFIGSHLARRLRDEGWAVRVVDNLMSGYRSNIPEGVTFQWLDLTRDDAVLELPQEPVDVVFHLASHVGQELSFDHPLYDFKANGQSTVTLLNWCKRTGTKRLVFASSMNVYGEPDNLPVTEAAAIKPPSPYAVGKISSEYLCSIYQHFGIDTTCLRLFNVYGPYQDMSNLMQGMISIYMNYVARGEPILVKGAMERFRDFVYVTDVADAFYRCGVSEKAVGKIYNVATGRKTFVREVLDGIIKAFGHDPADYPVIQGEPTRRDQFGIFGSSQKIRDELGWEPSVDLERGLAEMASWARAQRDAGRF